MIWNYNWYDTIICVISMCRNKLWIRKHWKVCIMSLHYNHRVDFINIIFLYIYISLYFILYNICMIHVSIMNHANVIKSTIMHVISHNYAVFSYNISRNSWHGILEVLNVALGSSTPDVIYMMSKLSRFCAQWEVRVR